MPSKRKPRAAHTDVPLIKKRASKKTLAVVTSEKGQSVVQYDDQPPGRFIDEVIQRAKELELPKQSIELSNPAKMAKALWMVAQMVPKRMIMDELKISPHCLRRLEYVHGSTLETMRAKFATKYAMIAGSYADLLQEKADMLMQDPDALAAISPDKLAVTVGVMSDKAAMMSGMASAVIEHRRGPSIEDAAAMIAEARARLAAKTQVIDAEVLA